MKEINVVDLTRTMMDIDKMPASYIDLQLGVWRVLVAKSVVKLPGKGSLSAFSLLAVFIIEIYTLAPNLVVFFVLTTVWSGIQSSLILRTSSHLLTVVSN